MFIANLNLIEFFICCGAAFVGGVVTAISGTGGLFTFPVYLILNIPPFIAQGTNKVMLSMGLFQSARKVTQKKMYKSAILKKWVITAYFLSAIATYFVLKMDVKLWSWLITGVILSATLSSVPLKKKERNTQKKSLKPWEKLLLPFTFLYDGFAGPTVGAMYQIVLNRLYQSGDKKDYHMNIGTARILHLVTALGSSSIFILYDKVLWILALYLGLFNSVGQYLGTIIMLKANKDQLQWTLFLLCLSASISLLIKLSFF